MELNSKNYFSWEADQAFFSASPKRGPGLGSFSRADRGIGVFQHVLPPMKLRLKYSR